MIDVMTIGGLILGVCVVFSVCAVYGIYGGPKMSLSNAVPGEVYNFVYEQPLKGDPERYMAKVISVHELDQNTINRLNRNSRYRKYDPLFCRTGHLVTCAMPNGETRNFYAERVKNCRMPLAGKLLFKTQFASML